MWQTIVAAGVCLFYLSAGVPPSGIASDLLLEKDPLLRQVSLILLNCGVLFMAMESVRGINPVGKSRELC